MIIVNIKTTASSSSSVLCTGAEYLTIFLPWPLTYYNSQDKPRSPSLSIEARSENISHMSSADQGGRLQVEDHS